MGVVEDVAKETLRKAAELLSERGHCKGTMQENDGSMCAVGALRTALYGDLVVGGMFGSDAPEWAGFEVEREVSYRLLRLIPRMSIPYWNDDPSTSAEDVILTLKKAAEL